METVKKFDFNGHSYEIRMICTEADWILRVFRDGQPLKVEGDISHQNQQDAEHQGAVDLRKDIADILEAHIRETG